MAKGYIHKRLLVLFILLVTVVVGVTLTGRAMVNAAAEAKTLDRDLEPVVVEGVKVASLIGVPIEHLFVYAYTGTDWKQIPIQVDEVTDTGSYTTTDGGLLDANDEIVFMAKDLGDRAPETAPLTGSLTISDTWYEIEVTDPLSPTKKGWAYLVHSSSLTHITDNYVDYSSAISGVTASQYDLGFATIHPGLGYLTLNGDSLDILDRTKLRAVLDMGVLGVTTVTEQILPNPGITVIKDGPIRVLLQQTVQENFPLIVEVNLNNTYVAYAALFQTISDVDFDLGSSITLSSIRTSADFDSVISGTATFYNATTPPGGFSIDGTPDTMAETPLSKWGQVSHPTGRLIQVIDPTPVGGAQQKNFYRDDSIPEDEDTGQSGSYGDTGILFAGDVNQMFTLRSSFFILPAGSDNVGATYEAYFSNPLLVRIGFQGADSTGPVFLPIILRNN